MDPRNFRGLVVWQTGMDLTEEVYQLSRQFPKQEAYGLSTQTQRAAVSIPANIAEGHARGSTKDFLRFLAIAQGFLAELETHLLLAERLHYCTEPQMSQLLDKCTREAKMLRSLRKRVRSRLQQ